MNSLVPRFLVIGAMKCGTTTLFEDLRALPDIYLSEKESGVLSGDTEDSYPATNPIAEYQRAFAKARGGQLLGEVATTYSMYPNFPGVVQHAADHLDLSDLRLIYIVRHPIRRILSHYHHDFVAGKVQGSADEVVLSDPRFIAYSSYHAQLEQWRNAVDEGQVLVVKFEDYMGDRQHGLTAVTKFLGVNPPTAVSEAIANASAGKPVARGPVARISQSPLYRKTIRRMIPEQARHRLTEWVLPKAPVMTSTLRPETVAELVRRLRPDLAAFAKETGCSWELGV